MNGFSLGGSKGLFTNPGKALGNMFSLKNVVPDVTTAIGYYLGGPWGAGIGETAGRLIEGKPFLTAAKDGLEAGGLAYGGQNLEAALSGTSGATSAASAASSSADSGASGGISGDISNIFGDIKGGASDILGKLGLSGSTGTASTAAAGKAGSGSIGGILGDLGLTKSNILPAVIDGAGVLKDLNQGSIPGQSQLTQEAQQLSQQGQQLQSYLQTGTLPAGLQSSVDSATQAAEAATRSQYAAMGLSGSSMETGAINQIHQNASAQAGSLALSLLQQGVNETQISSQIYQNLIALNSQQNSDTSSAIASLAAELAGGGTSNTSTSGTKAS